MPNASSPKLTLALSPDDEAILKALEATYEAPCPSRSALTREALRRFLEVRRGLRSPKVQAELAAIGAMAEGYAASLQESTVTKVRNKRNGKRHK